MKSTVKTDTFYKILENQNLEFLNVSDCFNVNTKENMKKLLENISKCPKLSKINLEGKYHWNINLKMKSRQ